MVATTTGSRSFHRVCWWKVRWHWLNPRTAEKRQGPTRRDSNCHSRSTGHHFDCCMAKEHSSNDRADTIHHSDPEVAWVAYRDDGARSSRRTRELMNWTEICARAEPTLGSPGNRPCWATVFFLSLHPRSSEIRTWVALKWSRTFVLEPNSNHSWTQFGHFC